MPTMWSETVIKWYFGLFWAAEKRNFPALGFLKSKKKVTTLSGMVVRNFFTLSCFARPDPQGRKIAKYWFCMPLALEKFLA